ncbi:hypothetical protein [Acholeplasma laidlawii]|uniref:hypothetical protein n=1 Tax=Acholeplasma laidlawii TaxID=2148 RepID=UPI00084C7A0A|nr:hypothetical protein [Acholeplasma laidlawii]OED59133.1 hypothetical protein BHS12_05430 [Acholeplasma laidlawii]
MGKIIFKRDKKFTNALVPVYIYLDDHYVGTISNGETLSRSTDKSSVTCFLVWGVSTDPKGVTRQSQKVRIDTTNHVKVLVRSKYSIRHGGTFHLELGTYDG